jgi:hypothetical protein
MTDLKALHHLIAAYLNEDWYYEYGEPWTAVEAFVRDEPDYAPVVGGDIRRLIAESASDSEVERCLDTFGLGYAATTAGWQDYGEWLLAVANRVDELLHTSPAA